MPSVPCVCAGASPLLGAGQAALACEGEEVTQGMPGRKELAARWQADSGLVRVLMPLLESALDLCPPSKERDKIEATYALACERYLAAQEAIKPDAPESRILRPNGRRF